MWTLQYTCVLLLVPLSLSLVSKAVVDELIIEGVNENVVDVKGFAYPCQKSTGGSCVNLTTIWKINSPDDTKMTLKATKWIRNDYKLVVFNIQKPLKNFIEIEAFSIRLILREFMHPPMSWPLRKNVPYRLTGFYMDASQFPSNIPEGRWLVTQIIEFGNKTNIVTMYWKMLVEYV